MNNTHETQGGRMFSEISLLSVVARKKIAENMPDEERHSYIYEATTGWETDYLKQDNIVCIVTNPEEMRSAFLDQAVHFIFVPDDASLTKAVVRRFCHRYAQEKTIFYEVQE